ncbi:MAG TPA: GatB/YqeY domain-containing protein [Sphingobacteriaceae bacterium]|nr:GatB/YqeY domain-containing protein [Sphingobacteriaceae bacterium]
MALQEKIDQDIKAAMLAKDNAQLRGLRAIKAALLLAKTEKGAGDVLSSEAETKVLQKLVKQRRESADIYQQQKRDDLHQIEMEEIAVIEAYLPKQLDRDEIVKIIQEIISQTGASSIKDMGKVMGMANQKLAGQADGKTIAEVVKSLL